MKNFIIKLQRLHLFLVEKNGELTLNKDKDNFDKNPYDFAKDSEGIIPFMKENKSKLIAYLKEEHKKPDAIYKLSPLQEGLLFHKLYDEDSKAYVDQLVVDLPKNLDTKALESSWNYVLKNHSILRSSFFYEEFSIPVQCVYNDVKMPFVVLDYTDYTPAKRVEELEAFLKKDLEAGFLFTEAPLLRVAIINMAEQGYKMVFTSHHIILDGWSLSIVIEELLEAYQSLIKDNRLPPQKEELYEDYIKYIANKDVFEEEKFWRKYLEGLSVPSTLPFSDTISGNRESGDVKESTFKIDADFTTQMKEFAQQHRLTLNTLIQGVWAILVSRYTGNSDVVFGVTVSGRPAELENTEDRVGLYINTLPLYSKLEADQLILDWLTQLQLDHTKCREHQYMNLAEIQKSSGIQGDLFDSILVFENYPISDIILTEESLLDVSNMDVSEQTNYPLTIDINLGGTELNIQFSYNTTLFDDATIEMIRGHFMTVLHQIIDYPDKQISDVTILTTEEEDLLLGRSVTSEGICFNPDAIDLDNTSPINVQFESIAASNEDAVAVIHNDVSWTYTALNSYANQIAHVLLDTGIEEEAGVGVYLDRSAEFIGCMLGIIKSGGSYTPLDTQNPPSRIDKMLSGGTFSVLITTSSLLEGLEVVEGTDVIVIDLASTKLLDRYAALGLSIYDQDTISSKAVVNPPNRNRMDSWAYVLYTSGSTGTPKGAITRHDGAMNHLLAEYKLLDLPDGFRFLQSAGIGSDISVWQILGPLLKGGVCVIVDKFELLEYDTLLATIARTKVSIVEFVPTYMWGLLSYIKESETPISLDTLQWIMLVGEAIPVALVNDLKRLYPALRLLNAYGPCEASDDVIQYEITDFLAEDQSRVPIGRVIPNMNVAILDVSGNLCPIGVAGELCVSGVGVGAGYIGLPERTAESFVANPFSDDLLGDVLYKTGDLGRWLSDGTIEFLGREDHQVKIRGHRVELEGIASVLRKDDHVEDCHVLVHKDSNGQDMVLCFLILSSDDLPEGVSITELLHTRCKEELPAYMHPSQYCVLEEFPVNLSDKVDGKALIAIYESDFSDGLGSGAMNYVAPRNDIEEQLVAIWQDLLHVDQVGVYDNFFELGGHSLLATRLVSTIRRELSLEIAIKDVFDTPTISDLGIHLSTQSKGVLLPVIARQEKSGRIPLSFSQERLWFIDQLQGSTEYHMPVVLKLKGEIDISVLEDSLHTIIRRHEILRTVIKSESGVGYQEVISSDNWKLNSTTLSTDVNVEKTITSFLEEPFDLSSDYMMKAQIYGLGEKEYLLAIVFHHISSDGWSEGILVSEFIEIYKAKKSRQPVTLPSLSLQYADYAIWQRKYVEGAVLDEQLTYWYDKLKGVSPLLLPTDYVRPNVQSTEGKYIDFKLDKELSDKIGALCKQEEVTLFMVLLSVFKVMLSRYTGQHDICVGTPIANRTQSDLEDMIGFFVNTLALRSDLSDNPSFKKVLQTVKETTLEAYDHQLASFEKVVDKVVDTRDMSMSPLFQVMFVLQNTPQDSEIVMDGLTIGDYEYKEVTAQFDLTLNVDEQESGIFLNMGYCTALFKEATIELMIEHYQELLWSVVENVEDKISSLSMLKNEELQTILNDFNPEKVTYPEGKTVLDVFEDQVQKTPKALAVTFEKQELTYEELDKRSNQLAQFLQKQGVKEEVFVGICIERSVEMLIGILGILKSGGAYVPIDPEYPKARINYIIEDTKMEFMLSSSASIDVIENKTNLKVTLLDVDWGIIAKESVDKLDRDKQFSEQLAYVIYTSGSTGKPKGVLINHKNLAALGFSRLSYYGSVPSMLLTSSFAFDSSVAVIWSSLLTGGTLVLCAKSSMSDAKEMRSLFTSRKISSFLCVPSYYEFLLSEHVFDASYLKYVILAGEQLSKQLVQRHYEFYNDIELYNEYGPTECSVWSSVSKVSKNDDKITIGTPIAHAQIYIVDNELSIVPIGTVGELCIGGAGVARGYLNSQNLTEEKFVSNPFGEDQGSRLYKTGDLGRWLPNGNIEFIGRKDDQVKIRGYRIELGEIEKVLLTHSLVENCCVLAKEDTHGSKRLIGFYVGAEIGSQELETYLKTNLPEYMVPKIWVHLDKMPLTSNGKTDKKALPDPDMSTLSKKEYVAPRNEIESQIVEIWQNLLGIDQIGIHDNFFELGGHSLLVTRLVSMIREELHIEIAIKNIFEFNTVEELSSCIEFIQLDQNQTEEEDTEEYNVTIEL